MPTIFNPNIQTSQCSSSSHIIPLVTVPRRSPEKGIYQDDQYQSFMNYNLIDKLSELTNLVFPLLLSELTNLVFPLLLFYSRKIMTMPPFTKLNLVKNAHLKLQNALKLTRSYMKSSFSKTVQFLCYSEFAKALIVV